MDLAAVAGVSPLTAMVGLLASISAIVVLARVLARRSRRSGRTLVNLSGRD
jgi:hypothetical protein